MDILSCQKAIGRDCFKAYPDFARRAIAYRLLHLLIPPEISKVLPTKLTDPLIAPGVKIPLDAKFPPGTVIIPGCDFPAGWNPKDEPPECVKSMPLPAPCLGGGGCIPNPYLAPGSPATSQVNPRSSPVSEPVTVEITSSTKDGHIRNDDSDWNTARTATTGNVVDDNNTRYTHAMAVAYWGGTYNIYRSFFYFDLAVIPTGKTISEVILLLTEHVYHNTGIAVFEGIQAATLTLADFGSFKSTEFANQAFADGENEITLNSDGIQHVQDNIGSGIKLCCRESDYDAGNIAPPASSNRRNGCYYADHPTAAYRPKLRITYA